MGDDWARPVVYLSIEARDMAALVPFYEALFHWRVGRDGPIRQFAPGLGGPEPGPGGHFQQGDHPGVSLYVQVADLAATLRQAVELGGRVTLEPLALPQGPTIAGIADPEGNRIGLVQQ